LIRTELQLSALVGSRFESGEEASLRDIQALNSLVEETWCTNIGCESEGGGAGLVATVFFPSISRQDRLGDRAETSGLSSSAELSDVS